MSNVERLPSSPPAATQRGRLRRAIVLLAGLAQFFGVIAGPLDHWRASVRLEPHAEAAGGSQSHYQHNEAQCSACAIGHMTAANVGRLVTPIVFTVGLRVSRQIAALRPFRHERAHAAPRAPPTAPLVG